MIGDRLNNVSLNVYGNYFGAYLSCLKGEVKFNYSHNCDSSKPH